jgi:hypothetical protein
VYHHHDRRGAPSVLLGLHLEPGASFNDAAFTFDPPDGAKRIVFAEEKR